jgi:hypothetical protein
VEEQAYVDDRQSGQQPNSVETDNHEPSEADDAAVIAAIE